VPVLDVTDVIRFCACGRASWFCPAAAARRAECAVFHAVQDAHQQAGGLYRLCGLTDAGVVPLGLARRAAGR
jgi:hypothetical protein